MHTLDSEFTIFDAFFFYWFNDKKKNKILDHLQYFFILYSNSPLERPLAVLTVSTSPRPVILCSDE
jgi:hypothetical protein